MIYKANHSYCKIWPHILKALQKSKTRLAGAAGRVLSLLLTKNLQQSAARPKISDLLLQNSGAGQAGRARALCCGCRWAALLPGGAVTLVDGWLSRYQEYFVLSFLSLTCQSQSNSWCGIFIPAASKSARGKMWSYHPAFTILQWKLPVLPLRSSLHHCHTIALTVLLTPEKSYQEVTWESSRCQWVPTNYFKLCLEHKNSPHPHLPSALERYLLKTTCPVGTGTSEAPTQCASQQRVYRTSSSWHWKHPKTSSTAQNICNSSCKTFDSHPSFPPSVLSREALVGRPGMPPHRAWPHGSASESLGWWIVGFVGPCCVIPILYLLLNDSYVHIKLIPASFCRGSETKLHL